MASGTESATETSYWIKFFTDALIPAGDAANYAILFSDNRIQRGMLLDLTKEYLTDMGVNRLGDVIAILKHAKTVHIQDAKDKALKGVKITGVMPSLPRRSTAASRIVDRFLAKDPEAAPMSQPSLPSKSAGAGKKSSVFDRLGSDSPVPGNSSNPSTGAESVFARLGGKSGQKRSASPDSDEESARSPLEYQGVLKFPSPKPDLSVPIPRKKMRVSVGEPTKALASTEKFQVTGLGRVRVAGIEHVKVARMRGFDVEDVQPIMVQVTSTTMPLKDKIKRRTTFPVSSLGDTISAAKKLSIQKNEVTTTSSITKTAGVLSMDAPTPGPVKTRLGKVQTAPASNTTSGLSVAAKTLPGAKILPGAKKLPASDVKSRLGTKPAASPASTSSSGMAVPVSARPRLTITTSASPAPSKAKATSGVFSRLGKKAS